MVSEWQDLPKDWCRRQYSRWIHIFSSSWYFHISYRGYNWGPHRSSTTL